MNLSFLIYLFNKMIKLIISSLLLSMPIFLDACKPNRLDEVLDLNDIFFCLNFKFRLMIQLKKQSP